MDPNATLLEILECFRDGDSDEALYLLEDLEEWLRKGGFAPTVTDDVVSAMGATLRRY